MTENNKNTSRIIKSEIEENESKDKDKLKDNDLNNLFNIVVNNYNETIKESEISNKKKNQVTRKISFKNYFSNIKEKYKINSQDKENSLNKEKLNDDLITIIHSNKNQFSLPHRIFSRNKLKLKKKKNKDIKIDIFSSKKFRNIRPQKDYFLRNNSTIFSSDGDNKLKNNSVKLRNIRSFNKIKRNAVSNELKKNKSLKEEINDKRKGIESNNSKVTCFLERKKINDLPVIYPLFLSYNNSYDTFSEKNRVEKI